MPANGGEIPASKGQGYDRTSVWRVSVRAPVGTIVSWGCYVGPVGLALDLSHHSSSSRSRGRPKTHGRTAIKGYHLSSKIQLSTRPLQEVTRDSDPLDTDSPEVGVGGQ